MRRLERTGYPVPTIIVDNLSPCIVFSVFFLSRFFPDYTLCMIGHGVKVVFIVIFCFFTFSREYRLRMTRVNLSATRIVFFNQLKKNYNINNKLSCFLSTNYEDVQSCWFNSWHSFRKKNRSFKPIGLLNELMTNFILFKFHKLFYRWILEI